MSAQQTYQDEDIQVLEGDCLNFLRSFESESFDAIITDPPYELGFMSKGWDKSGIAFQTDVWEECLRVAKPGSILLAFGSSRTWHRLAIAIEDAGWNISDSIAWLYAEGYPKSKHRLKPMFEPIVVASKGTALLNINSCKIGDFSYVKRNQTPALIDGATSIKNGWDEPTQREASLQGRWPGNAILDESASKTLDEQAGVRSGGAKKPNKKRLDPNPATSIKKGVKFSHYEAEADIGPASRYFPIFRFESKASQNERPKVSGIQHTTVKPLALMQWLIRLTTSTNEKILDPFAGSGTTGEAAILEGRAVTMIEKQPEYIPLIIQRLNRATSPLFTMGDAS